MFCKTRVSLLPQGLRTFAVASLLLAAAPAPTLGHSPDGLDCEQNGISALRCDAWKAKNADGQWWCDWDLEKGEMRAIYGRRGSIIPPGFVLSEVTEDDARNNESTKRILEEYARRVIAENEVVFGLQITRIEFDVIDFQRRPAGRALTLQTNGSLSETPLPEVFSIHLQQTIGRCSGPDGDDWNNGHGNDEDHDDESNPGHGGGNHGSGNRHHRPGHGYGDDDDDDDDRDDDGRRCKRTPLENATIKLQVDAEGHLLSFTSSFVTPPSDISRHGLVASAPLIVLLSK